MRQLRGTGDMHTGIGKKLGLGFGVAVLVMVLAGGYALYELSKSRGALRDVSKHKMKAALAAFGIRANFDEMIWTSKNILLRGTNEQLFDKELEIFRYKRDRLENIWTPMLEKHLKGPDVTDTQRELYSEFKFHYTIFINAWEETLKVFQEHGYQASDVLVRDRGRVGVEPLIELVRSLRDAALRDMEQAAIRTRRAVVITVVAFFVAMVIAVVATWYVVRQLTTTVQQITATRPGDRQVPCEEHRPFLGREGDPTTRDL
jgi:methyl-accepting chemotaxis protein